jgi:hypothetical protein
METTATSRHHRTPDAQRRRRQLAIGGVIVGAVVLLLVPLQTILAIILAGSVWTIAMASIVWIERKVAAKDRERVVAALPYVAGGVVLLGIVLSFVIPTTMAAVTLVIALVAAVAMAFLSAEERKAGSERRTA